MDLLEKIDRANRRKHSINLDKKNRHKGRHLLCGEYGKRFVGNSCKTQFCTYCRPTLTNTLLRKKDLRDYLSKSLKYDINNDEDYEEEIVKL